MDWKVNDPIKGLENYNENYPLFEERKKESNQLKEELQDKSNELSNVQETLDITTQRLQEMGEYKPVNIAEETASIESYTQSRVEAAKSNFDMKKEQLESDRDQMLLENDTWLKESIAQILAENNAENHELTATEKQALEFEIERRKLVNQSNKQINDLQDAQVQEKLDCKTQVGQWKQQQDAVTAQYTPGIEEVRDRIYQIKEKHRSEIESAKYGYDSLTTQRDNEIALAQQEKARIQSGCDQAVKELKRISNENKKNLDIEIKKRKRENKTTYTLENKQAAQESNYKEKIADEKRKAANEIGKVDNKIDATRVRYETKIAKAKTTFDRAVQKQADELREPQSTYNSLTAEMESQINALQTQINERNAVSKNKLQQLENAVKNEQSEQQQRDANVDAKIIEFVMSGNNCYDDVQDETYAPYVALQTNVEQWMTALSSIAKGNTEAAYKKEHEKQKKLLAGESFDALQAELAAAQAYNGQVSVIAKLHLVFVILGGVAASLGLGWFFALYGIIHNDVGMSGLLVALVGAALVVFALLKTKQEFAKICRYVSLAADFGEFPGLKSHMAEETQRRELEKMKRMGAKLYDVYYGKVTNQNIHDEKEQDILADFDRDLRMLEVELENALADYKRECDEKIRSIRKNIAEDKADYFKRRNEGESSIRDLQSQIGKLTQDIQILQDELAEKETFLKEFDKNYAELIKNVEENKDWKPARGDRKGKFSDKLYIIPDKAPADEYKHKRPYEIIHNRRPLVFTYELNENESVSQAEALCNTVSQLLMDVMYAIYHMNESDTYTQVIVDGAACAQRLKQTSICNAFAIKDNVPELGKIKGYLEELETRQSRYAERGQNIDDVNAAAYEKGERPEKYNILYMIYAPNDKHSHLDDQVRRLTTECGTYGFLPIFICEKEAWQEGLRDGNKESLYREIASLTKSKPYVYDGKSYSPMN